MTSRGYGVVTTAGKARSAIATRPGRSQPTPRSPISSEPPEQALGPPEHDEEVETEDAHVLEGGRPQAHEDLDEADEETGGEGGRDVAEPPEGDGHVGDQGEGAPHVREDVEEARQERSRHA